MKKEPLLPHIALVQPLYPENVGFVARLIKNFNSTGLVLIDPQFELDKAYKTAVHASDILKNSIVLSSFEELRKRFSFLVGTTARVASDYNLRRSVLYPWALPKLNPHHTALVFGREDTGLRNEELEECDVVVTIPTSSKYESMNLSHAVAVLLYELFSRGYRRRYLPLTPAPAILYRVIYSKLKEITELLNYPPGKDHVAYLTLRRAIGKAYLTEREAHGILGVLSRILKKLKDS